MTPPAAFDRGKFYRALTERFGWTPSQIAELTPAQIAAYLEEGGNDPRTGRSTRKFASRAEAEAFMRSMKP